MDKLFLLSPHFKDDNIDDSGTHYYCPDCAMIEGVIKYYPHLRDELEIIYVDFQRPRKILTELIGEENQNCPALVIESAGVTDTGIAFKSYGEHLFVNSVNLITGYLAERYGIGSPHP